MTVAWTADIIMISSSSRTTIAYEKGIISITDSYIGSLIWGILGFRVIAAAISTITSMTIAVIAN